MESQASDFGGVSCDRVFVYGTLRQHPPHEAAELLRGKSMFIGFATIPGTLYDLGPFPGAVPVGDPHDVVVGEVHRMADPDATLTVLDDYEGCGENDPHPHLFRREIAVATLESGVKVECAVYWYTRATHDKRRIPSGDYHQGRT
jgi:gamma-glutamylcyclotransferase (GGCT)/AIG2-like uncharacterized protein YtfP